MLKFVMYLAMFIGAIVIASWLSRDASYFFNNLLYWIRYNWMPALGLVVIGAIAFKAFKS
jgi:hypothetical protein